MSASTPQRTDVPRSPPGDDARDVAAPEELARLANQLREARNEIERLSNKIDMLAACGGSYLAYWFLAVFTTHRLIITKHHAPRPLYIPSWYQRAVVAAPPLMSIVTPSYNQGPFLERTLRSVLDQGYPRLEYVVQDGGSTDESVSIIRRHAERLTHWESAADAGQAAAINRGFRHTSGEIMAYLNSDDLLLPGTLHYVAEYFSRHPDVDVIYGHRVLIDEEDGEVGRWVLPPHDDRVLTWVDYVPQETLFWRRRVWERVGGAVDEAFHFALDWDLLLRLREAGARFVRLPRFLGAFRLHNAQKSVAQRALGDAEMNAIRRRCHGRTVYFGEIGPALRRYLFWQVVLRHMYRLGLVRY